MDDFDILNEIINENEKNSYSIENKDDEEVKESVSCCPHDNIREENSKIHCIDCGFEIKNVKISEKKNSDPMRCQIRKSEDKTIYKDVESMDFSDKIIGIANDLYQQVTKNKIFRGNTRKAIVFACVFHSFKILGNPQSCETLQHIFKLDRKVILKGLKHVSLNAPKELDLQCKYITPLEIINEIMDRLNADKQQKQEIFDLYNEIKNKNKSIVLNRSKPQSIASGIIFYYIKVNKKDIDLETFTKKVNLSQSTIIKVTGEIEKILDV